MDVVLVILALVVYLFPTLMGLQKANAFAIFMLNLFLGWTFIGWVIALVWACTVDKESE